MDTQQFDQENTTFNITNKIVADDSIQIIKEGDVSILADSFSYGVNISSISGVQGPDLDINGTAFCYIIRTPDDPLPGPDPTPGPHPKSQLTLTDPVEEDAIGQVEKIEVKINNGPYSLAIKNGTTWANWSWSKSDLTSGTYTLRARITLKLNVRPPRVSAPTTVVIDADAPVFENIQTNDDNLYQPPYRVVITGEVSDASSISSVQWKRDNGSYNLAENLTGNWSRWRASVNLLTLGDHTVTLRATDSAGNQKTLPLSITAADRTVPDLEIISPLNGTTVVWAEGGITIEMNGTANDTESGVDRVQWSLDGENYTEAIPQSPGNWATWDASVFISDEDGPGEYVINVQAIDRQGNIGSRDLIIDVAETLEPRDPQDVFTLAAYLDDLLSFATDRVTVPGSDGEADLTLQQLVDNFYQPFISLSDLEIREKVEQPISHVRICIEVLRQYLAHHGVTLSPDLALPYSQAAYFELLGQLGTNYEELRLARIADDDTRTALANRLGFSLSGTRPDELDALLLQPESITETVLETLFGLVDTTREPLDTSDTLSDLLLWQLAYLRSQWLTQDHAMPGMGENPTPIIDPDLVSQDNLTSQVPTHSAYMLWNERSEWIVEQLQALRTERENAATQLAGFDAIAITTFGSVDELLTLAEEYGQGRPIQPQLQALHLQLKPFLFLIQIRKLAEIGTVLEQEWTDVYDILVQVQKQQNYPTWRTQERTASISLSPDQFQLLSDPVENRSPWRSPSSEYRAWRDTLISRTIRYQDVIQALQNTIAAVEATRLPMLRNALIATAIPNLPVDEAAERLTQHLVIDLKSSGQQITTRLNQAIETVQGILFALRTERFASLEPLPSGPNVAETWTLIRDNYTEDLFDQEWQWMGVYNSWRAAMLLFFYPENDLLPTWREPDPLNTALKPTEAFNTLVAQVRQKRRLTPDEARQFAQAYLDAVDATDLPEGFELTDQLTEEELINRRDTVLYPLFNGIDNPHLAPSWLQETLYFVPMLLASQLQQSGEYLAALGWFRTLYNDERPIGDRKIYPGLALEADIDTTYPYPRNEDWLVEELNPHAIVENRKNAYTRFTLISLVRCFLAFADAEFTRDTPESRPRARALYITALDLLKLPEIHLSSEERELFPANPIPDNLKLQADLNLAKLRSNRNIAGIERQNTALSPFSATNGLALPIFDRNGQLVPPQTYALQPTPYRYPILIERAKELVSLAQQVESAFLVALKERDAEAYNLFQAQQDLELSYATVDLQNLRISESETGELLAQLQQDRIQIQSETLQDWLTEGLNGWERLMISNYQDIQDAQIEVIRRGVFQSFLGAIPAMATGNAAGAFLGMTNVFLDAQNANANTRAIVAETRAKEASVYASYDRRRQEWELEKQLAEHDMRISDQQISRAHAQTDIVRQEKVIAETQTNQAQATVDFLANKFTNVELYEWMSSILESVYNYFLQQATAIAQLAQNQLAFERQETPTTFIQSDYWQTPVDALSSVDASDRRGLTGSVRLLQDIYKLDQYAFETNKRKLQLSQTFSLAQLAPAEFQRFRQTGVLPFATPMELFDRDFPGHYLRLIKRVSVSVVALVPPSRGIRATLTSSGISRVTIGQNTSFQDIMIRRDPELIAFTSPHHATGLLELEPENNLLLPFEGIGVDTLWEFQMPRAANPFDYRMIADVIFSIEYTALHDSHYRQHVIQQLDTTVSADRLFNMRQKFADQWYELHNPEQSVTPMVVQFDIRREDFPSNVEDLRVQHMLLHVVRRDGVNVDIPIRHLHLTPTNTTEPLGGGASTVDGTVSTRRSNGQSWTAMIGASPIGNWELALDGTLADGRPVSALFDEESIDDILLVITYQGETPEWPQ